jgi:hypothetical protein
MAFAKNMNKYSKGVTMPGGYAHFLPDTLRKIDRYWAGKFLGGDLDTTKKHKYFAQMARPLSEDASKSIDIETSMIKLISTQSGKDLSMWVMSRELQEWLEDHSFDALMNDLGDNLPKYGHIVLKKHAGGLDLVNIQNLRMDPSAPWLKYSDFAYELHRMMKWEITEQKDWDGNAIEQLFKGNKSQDFDIYEAYDMKKDHYELSQQAWFKKPNAASGGSSWNVEANINQPQNLNQPPIVLYKEDIELSDLPYRENKWSAVPGRWLGMGVMEYLFDDQLHANETANLRMRALYLKALKLLQSSDDNVGGNVLREMQNGQVIKSAGTLKWLTADESDLSGFSAEDSRWDTIASKKTFVMDAASIPSKMNKQMLQSLMQQQQNYYKKKRENVGIFLKDLLYRDIIPDFKYKSQKEHMMSFVSSYDDIDQYAKFVTEAQVSKAAQKYMKKHGFMPSESERMKESTRIENEIRKRNMQVVKIPKDFYEDLVYKIKIVITGENKDIQGETAFLMQLMQLVGQNPAVLQNKMLRTIVFKLMELAGISPGDIGMLDQAVSAQQSTQPQDPTQGGNPPTPQLGGSNNATQPNPQQQTLSPGAPMAKQTAGNPAMGKM